MQQEFKVNVSNDDLIQSVLEYVSSAKNYYVENIKPAFEENYNVYFGRFDEEKYNSPKGSYVSKDVQVAIHSVIPDIVKLVFTDEPVKIVPQGSEDVELARNMQVLLNYQVTSQNEYIEIMEKVSIDALISGVGIIKCIWDKQVEPKEFTDLLNIFEIEQLKQLNSVVIKSIEFYSIDNNTGVNLYKVTYQKDKVVKNQPVYFRVDYKELLYDPVAVNNDDVRYYIHRRLVSADYLKRQADLGIFNQNEVDYIIDMMNNNGGYICLDYDADDKKDYSKYENISDTNKALDTVMLYEYWGKYDINQDGYLEDVIITFVGDRILSVQENIYKMYPFFIFTPYYDTTKLSGIGIGELISSVQNIKTVLTREFFINVRKNNNRKILYKHNMFVNPMQLETDEQFIALNKDADPHNVFVAEPYESFSNQTQNLITYFDRETQRISGISDIKSGVRSSSQGTATEATIKYEASNSQIQLIAVHFALSMKRLYKFIIYQNKQFLDDTITLRLFNKDIEINPDTLKNVDFDLNVSVNLGGGTKQEMLLNYQTAYKMLGEIMQLGLTDNIKIRNLLCKMLETMGLKDTDSYLISEQELISNQQQLKLQEQAALMNNANAVGGTIDINNTVQPNQNKLPLQI